MPPAQRGSRIVFVGNIPYDTSEEQLAEVFAEVGKVVEFRLIFDSDTGKPKGYGFCEFEDAETAASAVRNLNGTPVSGRPLRVDYAGEDPKLERTGAHGGQGGAAQPRGSSQRQWPQPPPGAGLEGALPPNLPQGQALPPGLAATDAISQTLAALPPNQLLDILGQMRSFVTTSPEQAKSLLGSYPQLAYALFQAMLMMNIVDPAVLQRMMTASSDGMPGAGGGGMPQQGFGMPGPPGMAMQGPGVGMGPGPGLGSVSGPAPGPGGMPGAPQGWGPQRMAQMAGPAAGGQRGTPPPGPGMRMPPQAGYAQPGGPLGSQFGGPPPPQQQQQPRPPAAPATSADNLGDQQRQLLNQVLSLTQEQISALPPDQRATIMQLRAQFQA